MKYKTKEEVKNLINKILSDSESMDTTIDHDFELSACLRLRHIKQINKVLAENKICFRLVNCKYSIPYGCDKNYKTPYFVNTEVL